MINFLISFLLFAFVCHQLFSLNSRFSRNKKVRSSVDNRYYYVKNRDNPQMELESANTLAVINGKIGTLIEKLETSNYNTTQEQRDWVVNLKENYNPDSLSETTTSEASHLNTFTINKGEKISFCLRCRNCKTKQIEPINTLMFVAIHELAHVANKEEGHGAQFQKINKFLLNKAVENGLWRYQDYSESPENYCNIVINSLPK